MSAFKISFPHMGDYHLPIARLLRDLFPGAEVFPAPPTTQKTLELGSRVSPDFVCSPFKYNMGNYIEALNAGANVLLQTGMGCRYGYYGEVQEQILRDLGYEFEFICLSRERARPNAIYDRCKALNPALTRGQLARAVALAALRIRIMDRLEYILRERVGFACSPGEEFERKKREMLAELAGGDTAARLLGVYQEYRKIYDEIPVSIPQNVLRVGVVGELFTLMEPFSNHYLEKQLAQYGVAVSRKMSVTFLLFGRHDRQSLQTAGCYLQYPVGANGLDSVAQCRQYAREGYDGVLHLKSFGCTPELNAQPALTRLGRELGIPILHLSFDTQTSAAGVQTRIEAFADMIKMKRDQIDEKNRQPGGGRRLHLDQGRLS